MQKFIELYEMLQFSGNNQKIFWSPPEHFAIGYVCNDNLPLGNIALQYVIQNNCRKVWWCFAMISYTFWRSRKKLLNSPKLSCGFNRGFEHLFFILYFDSYSATNKSTLPLLFHFENIPFELTRVRDEEVDWCLWGGCREGVEEAACTPCLGQGGGTFTLVEHIHIVAWSCHKRHTNPWLFYLWLTLLISHQMYIFSFF